MLVKARPEHQPKVDALLAAIRDEKDKKRARIALLPDLDVAGRAFEELEDHEERRLVAALRR